MRVTSEPLMFHELACPVKYARETGLPRRDVRPRIPKQIEAQSTKRCRSGTFCLKTYSVVKSLRSAAQPTP